MMTPMNTRGMSRLLKWLLISCLAGSSWVFAQMDGAIPYVHEKTHVLPSGKKVDVNLRERRCKNGECREVDGGMWGMDSGIPRVITETLRVRIEGRSFPIPEKFYKDFTNTHAVNVSEDKERIILELKGGDGAGAYTARFVLEYAVSSAESAARYAKKSGSAPLGTILRLRDRSAVQKRDPVMLSQHSMLFCTFARVGHRLFDIV